MTTFYSLYEIYEFLLAELEGYVLEFSVSPPFYSLYEIYEFLKELYLRTTTHVAEFS